MAGANTKKSAKKLQQELAQWLGAENIIPWDLYTSEDHEYLVKKISLLIPDAKGKDKKTVQRNEKLETIRNKLVDATWNQRKYNAGQLFMSILYVVWTEPSGKREESLEENEYSVHPVLRVRKCRTKNGDSENCCMIFIDECARVYKNWQDYIEENTLPKGVIVAPKRGYYAFDNDDQVMLECQYTPASSFAKAAEVTTSVVADIVGIVATGGMVGVALVPVVAPVVAPIAFVAGIVSGFIGAASSVSRLIDRGKHEECIDLSDSQARADWIGVVGGAASICSTVATKTVIKVARAGRSVPTIANGAINGLNFAAILATGAGVGNNLIEMIINLSNDKEITSMDVFQLSASLFLVTHSVYNFRMASTIVDSSRSSKIAKWSKRLSSEQRKAFDRYYEEIVRVKGPSKGKMDVIRSIKTMPDSKQLLNENGMRAAFHPDRNIIRNNDSPRKPSSAQITKFVLNVTKIVRKSVLAAIGDKESFEACVNHILSRVTEEALEKLLELADRFYSKFVSKIQQLLGRFISLEEILFHIFQLILKKCYSITNIDKYIKKLTPKDISTLFGELRLLYKHQEPSTVLVKCKECDGYYSPY